MRLKIDIWRAWKMACATIYIYLIYLDMYSMKHVAAILTVHVCILLLLAHLSDVKAIEHVVFMIVLRSRN